MNVIKACSMNVIFRASRVKANMNELGMLRL